MVRHFLLDNSSNVFSLVFVTAIIFLHCLISCVLGLG